MGRVIINDLATVLVDKFGIGRREAQRFIATMVDTIQDGVDSDKLVKIRGLGTFKVIEVDSRESVNVNTGERVVIDSHSKLTFTPDNAMKELVNKPFSQFETVVLNDGVDFSDEQSVPEKSFEEPEQVEETFSMSQEPSSVIKVENSSEEPEDMVEAETSSVPEQVNAEIPVVPAEQAQPVQDGKTLVDEMTPDTSHIADVDVSSDVDDTDSIDTDQTQAEDTDNTNVLEDDEAPTHRSKWWLWLLVGGLCFAVGYYLGMQKSSTETVEVNSDNESLVQEESVIPVDTAAYGAQSDTLSTDSLAVDSVTTVIEDSVVETLPAVEAEPDYKKYEAMDVRVRTGAYHIVGTAQIVQVRPGDTTRRLAKRYLGEGMECYIEVYNGITAETPLEAGQDIKIPELKWKKKNKK